MKLTHLDDKGRATMVDVSEKPVTHREAVASGSVRMKPGTLALIRDHKVAKGDVLAVARVAGIMAAKKTSELIPLCHPLGITSVELDFKFNVSRATVTIKAVVRCSGQTGVEMEALTAVSAAALVIYDMCKAVDKEMVITDILLLQKKGGKSGEFRRGAGGGRKT